MKTEIKGTLEIDHERGVIYFHAEPDEHERIQQITVMRVGGLPRPVPSVVGFQLDLQMGLAQNGRRLNPARVNWRGDGVMTDDRHADCTDCSAEMPCMAHAYVAERLK